MDAQFCQLIFQKVLISHIYENFATSINFERILCSKRQKPDYFDITLRNKGANVI